MILPSMLFIPADSEKKVIERGRRSVRCLDL